MKIKTKNENKKEQISFIHTKKLQLSMLPITKAMLRCRQNASVNRLMHSVDNGELCKLVFFDKNERVVDIKHKMVVHHHQTEINDAGQEEHLIKRSIIVNEDKLDSLKNAIDVLFIYGMSVTVVCIFCCIQLAASNEAPFRFF